MSTALTTTCVDSQKDITGRSPLEILRLAAGIYLEERRSLISALHLLLKVSRRLSVPGLLIHTVGPSTSGFLLEPKQPTVSCLPCTKKHFIGMKTVGIKLQLSRIQTTLDLRFWLNVFLLVAYSQGWAYNMVAPRLAQDLFDYLKDLMGAGLRTRIVELIKVSSPQLLSPSAVSFLTALRAFVFVDVSSLGPSLTHVAAVAARSTTFATNSARRLPS